MSVGIGTDKDPVALTQYRSQGDTIPYIAAGTEVVGAIIERGPVDMQQIGQVQSLSATDMTKGVRTGDANAGYSTDATASAGSEIQLRVWGMILAPIATGTYTDGQLVQWNATNSNFEADTTGAHELVGAYANTDTHALVRINIAPRAATT